MALPRSKYVIQGQPGVYHCFTRCVRRAFLCGFDSVTLRDFSHRKSWIVHRLRFLSTIFAIEVCAYAILDTHYHSVLRTRPDIAASWSPREVATRWLTLFPKHSKHPHLPPSENDIAALAALPDRIASLRQRLCNISWFIGRLNEFIARAANKEDHVKGRFWESRFKCQPLLDLAAITSCMVYVDLNPIRARIADTPENSHFTSIQHRIRLWHKQTTASPSPTPQIPPKTPPHSPSLVPLNPTSAHPQDSWLCPIQSVPGQWGILNITPEEYFHLVDMSGRLTQKHKRGTIDPDLVPILLRIGANPQAWIDTVSRFASTFRLAAGLVSSLRSFADRLGSRWLQGTAAARIAFSGSIPLPA